MTSIEHTDTIAADSYTDLSPERHRRIELADGLIQAAALLDTVNTGRPHSTTDLWIECETREEILAWARALPGAKDYSQDGSSALAGITAVVNHIQYYVYAEVDNVGGHAVVVQAPASFIAEVNASSTAIDLDTPAVDAAAAAAPRGAVAVAEPEISATSPQPQEA